MRRAGVAPAPGGAEVGLGALARPSTRAMREAVALAALAGIVVVCVLLVAGAAAGPSDFVRASRDTGLADFDYPAWLAGPLRGWASPLSSATWIALLAVLAALYGVVLWLADSVRARWALAAILAAHVVFVLGPPLWLSDVFNYLGFARLGTVHGLDPYRHSLAAIHHDPVYAYTSWRRIVSPYGPLFTLATYPLGPLGVAAGTWVLKFAGAGASLGCVALVWRLARMLGRPAVPAVLFVGLNPLWLVFEVGGAHNDALAVLLVLGAALLALRGREAAAGGLAVAAAAVKVTLGLALPFLWLASRRRARVAAGVAAAALAVVALCALAFGEVGGALGSFANQGDYVSLRSVPGQLSDAVLEVRTIPHGLAMAALGAFAAVTAVLLVLVARGADWLSAIGWAALALLLSITWLMPWYAAWLLPFAAVGESRRLRSAALVLTAFLLVVRLPYPELP